MVKGCGNACMKFLLFTFNFVFVAIGAALVLLGGYILIQAKNWEQIVEAPDAGAILVVIVGAVTFIVAFFGCCGASQESSCMLSTYAFIVGVVFLAEIAAAILLLLYTQEITKLVRDGVNKSFDRYKTSATTNPIDGVVDFVQSSFECCGTTGKNYWYEKPEWRTRLPLSCCRRAVEYSTRGSCGEIDRPGTEQPFSQSCQTALDDFLRLFTGLLSGILIFAAAIKIIAACFACALANAVQY